MSLDLLVDVPFKERVRHFAGNEKTLPKRITKQYLEQMEREGRAVHAPSTVSEAAECIDSTDDRLIILPDELQITFDESNRMIKKPLPGEFISYNSKRTLERAVEYAHLLGYVADKPRITQMTVTLAENLHLTPELMLRAGIATHTSKTPIGFAWTKMGRKRLTTWSRVIEGYALADETSHVTLSRTANGKQIPGKFYGNTIRCWAPSQSSPTRAPYSYQLRNLPITKQGAHEMYSMWFDLETNDPDPDGEFRGGGFNKKSGNIYWTRNAIAGFILAGRKLKEAPLRGGRMMYINPFPQINEAGRIYVEKLRTVCVIHGEIGNAIPNMTTRDMFIGEQLKHVKYDGFFKGKKEYRAHHF